MNSNNGSRSNTPLTVSRPSLKRNITDRITTAKAGLCLLVSFSAFFGYCFAANSADRDGVYVAVSVFLLACGAASLNSYQERWSDRLMERTAGRPLVLHKLTRSQVFLQASLLIGLGLAVLFHLSVSAAMAGVAALTLYNLVYTPMKKRTVNALIPGALCGALPPYIGWLAAGGAPAGYGALLIITLLILWQIPHFFLVLLNNQSDYSGSVFPNMLRRVEEQGVVRMFLPWVGGLGVVMILFSTVTPLEGELYRILMVMNGLLLFAVFTFTMLGRRQRSYRFLFHYLNVSLSLHMLIVCLSSM